MASPEELIGRREKCPKCGTLTVVPRQRTVTPQSGQTPDSFGPVMNIGPPRANPSGAFAAAGVIVGAVACLTLWYPIAYLPTILLGVVGLIAAGLAHITSRPGRRRNMATPFMTVVLCGVGIYFSLFPSGVPTFASGPSDESTAQTPTPQQQPQQPPASSNTLPIGMARIWDDRELKVLAAKIDHVPLRTANGASRSRDKFFMIAIRATNTSANTTRDRNMTYVTLRGVRSAQRTHATLRDSNGKFYRRINFAPNIYPTGGVPASKTLLPGGSLKDYLIFERPTRPAGPYHLELPLSNLGGTGVATWEIPQSALR